jgi:hypothetical protein
LKTVTSSRRRPAFSDIDSAVAESSSVCEALAWVT